MPKKRSESSKQTSVRVGNISDISGNVSVAGKAITTHHTVTGLSVAKTKQLFDELYSQIDARTDGRFITLSGCADLNLGDHRPEPCDSSRLRSG